MLHVLDKEMGWRKLNRRRVGFESLHACKPTVADGVTHSLEATELKANHSHGMDGLYGVHDRFSDPSPDDTWKCLFEKGIPVNTDDIHSFRTLFKSSGEPAHKKILRLLADNLPNTISIAFIGPMTNIVLAAATDPETFLRVKEVAVMEVAAMDGAFNAAGNITPVAEFNVLADPVAAAILFAMTSPDTQSTMPSVCTSLLSNIGSSTKWKQ
ncbi:hypothetical protein ACHAPV_009462 [Trichoderma viride]